MCWSKYTQWVRNKRGSGDLIHSRVKIEWNNNCYLNNDEENKLENILIDYDKSVNTTPVSKSKIPYKQEINLNDDVPVATQPRVIPYLKKQQIYEKIQQMLNDEIIQSSDSSYSSAVVPVIKKDGSIRMYIDDRQLNAKTIPKSYPIPRYEDLFEGFSDAEVFTVLDLSSAYWVCNF